MSTHFANYIFRLMFFNQNLFCFDLSCSLGSNKQLANIGSDNGLTLNRWQVVIWTNDGLIYWCIYIRASLNIDELNERPLVEWILSIHSKSSLHKCSILNSALPYLCMIWFSYKIWLCCLMYISLHFDEFVQERRNSIANALELRLSCTNPSICSQSFTHSISTAYLHKLVTQNNKVSSLDFKILTFLISSRSNRSVISCCTYLYFPLFKISARHNSSWFFQLLYCVSL